MGEHKYNQTAIEAKNGNLPPKPPRKSKKQIDNELKGYITQYFMEKAPGVAAIMAAFGHDK